MQMRQGSSSGPLRRAERRKKISDGTDDEFKRKARREKSGTPIIFDADRYTLNAQKQHSPA